MKLIPRVLKIGLRNHLIPSKPFSVKKISIQAINWLTILSIGFGSFSLMGERALATTFTFNTPGTSNWTVPAGVTAVIMEAWGAGGAGAGETGSGAGGGGAGGQYAAKTLAVYTGEVYSVTVAATTTGGTGNGGTGQDSSVTNPSSTIVVLAKGGAGGFTSGAQGSGSSSNGIGDTVNSGGNGGLGTAGTRSGGGGGGAGSTGAGGSASGSTAGTGTSTNGGNGGAGITAKGNGNAGSIYGGGGSGAFRTNGASQSGGNGAQGLVTITTTTGNASVDQSHYRWRNDDGGEGPTTIRQEINIFDGTVLTTSSTSLSIVQLDTTKYSGTVSYYFEIVTGSSSASTDSVTLTRNGTSTNDATVTLAGTNTNVRVRSSAFTPPAGQTEYVVKTGAIHAIKAARIIIIQKVDPLTGTESQVEIGGQGTNINNTTASPLTGVKYWHYTAANWDGTKTFSAEVTKSQSATNSTVTATIQQDNGSFASWTDVATIVSNTTTADTRYRVTFTPTDGRNYRLSFSETNASAFYNIYNGKVIVDQSGTPTKFESQYLVTPTSFTLNGSAAGYPTLWDSNEWHGATTSFFAAIDVGATTTSAELADTDNSNSILTNSNISGTNQVIGGTALTMPTSGHQIDAFGNSANAVSDSRIIADVTVPSASGSWLENEDTIHLNEATSTNVRLRFLIKNTGSQPIIGMAMRLQYATFSGSCGTFSDVPTTAGVSDPVGMTTSTNFTNQDPTTDFGMTDPGGLTFTSGNMVQSTSNQTNGISLAANIYTTVEFNFAFTSNATAGGTYCFRASNNGLAFDSYTNTAQITIAGGAAAPTTDQEMRGGAYFSNGTKQPYYWAQ